MDEQKKVTNTMKLDNENFSMNEDAERIIQENNEKKELLKRKNIRILLDVLNNICKNTGSCYFAAGALLTYWNEDKDPYPDSNTYQIRMFRKDYDTITEYLTAHAGSLGVNIQPMYYENKMVMYFTYTLSNAKSTSKKDGDINEDVSFKLIPMDEVPADEKEREAFFNEVILKNRWLRGYSRDYADMYKGQRSFSDKIKAKLAGFFTYNDKFFKKQYEELSALFRKYNGQDTGCYARLEMKITRVEKKEDILPIRTVDFCGTSIMVPANLKMFLLPNASDYANHIRSVRSRALKKFDELCEKNGLSYFSMGALLIESMQEEPEEVDRKSNWKVGMLRADYDKVMKLLADEKTSGGLALKRYQDDFITVPRREAGFICVEDDYPDVSGKNYQVLMEVFDYLPKSLDDMPELTLKMKQMREEYEQLVRKEHGQFLPQADLSAMDQLKKMNDVAKKAGSQESGRVARLVTGYGKATAISEIFPIKKKNFRGFKLSVPNNEYLWYDKNHQDKGYAESITAERTELLKIFDDFCTKESIEYFAIANLLIGAVIYHDAIPNKADTGAYVGLVRDQYEKAIRLLREKQSELGIVLTEYLDVEKQYPCKIRYISFPGNEYSQKVVFISAFDKLPESFYLRRSYREELRALNAEYTEVINFGMGKIKKYEKMYTPEELAEKTKKYADIDVKALYNNIDTLAQKYNDDPQAYAYSRSAFSFSKIIDVEDLYPLQRLRFRDVDLLCPHDYSVWQPIQDESLLFQVKCIQEVDKELMQEMDRVCKELGLGYFVCGGTMLGYMRHKGFIPWDDDVDVAMLRADYDKFVKEAGPLFKKGIFLQTRQSDPNIPYLFSKVRVDNTEYITEWNRDKNFHKGICLDVFPFDYVPNDLKERAAFVQECRDLSAAHNAIANGQYGEMPEPFEPRNDEERRKIAEVKAEIEKFNKMSLKESQDRYLAVATRYNDKAEELGLKTVASFVPTYTYIDVADLLPYQRGMFEDIETSVPKRPDIFLEMQYGDYMQLPPLHARVAHRLVRWSDGVHGADNDKKRDYTKKDN